MAECVSYVFCNDAYLLEINQQYLQHNTYTDIITFPFDEDPITAEVYISLDRVRENSHLFSNGNVEEELLRVIVHGVLHLCGHKDDTPQNKALMRTRESTYVQMYLEMI